MGRKIFVTSDMCVDERLLRVGEQDPTAVLLWPWILMAFDDWGRAEASPISLKAKLFPGVVSVTPNDVEVALQLYAEVGMLQLYEQNGKRYMAIEPDKWFKYQTHIRKAKRDDDSGSKHPGPASDSSKLDESARDCAQVREGARNCTPSPSPSPSLSLSKTSTFATRSLSTPNSRRNKQPPKEYTAEFEQFWQAYPRSVGKKKTFALFWFWTSEKKESPERLIKAAQNYARVCRQRRTEVEFIKHPATFLSKKDEHWLEWVEKPPELPGQRAGRAPDEPEFDFSDVPEEGISVRLDALMGGQADGQANSQRPP